MVHMATGVNLHTFNCHNHNPVIPLNAIQEFSIHFNEYVRQVGADQYLNNQLSSTTYVNPLLTIVHPPAGFQRPITRSDLDSIQDPEYNEIRDTVSSLLTSVLYTHTQLIIHTPVDIQSSGHTTS